MENKESYLATAWRETLEECNIDILINKRIKALGLFPYLKKKDLYLFLVSIKSVPKLECNSFFEGKNGPQPEMVDFKWIDFDEHKKYINFSLQKVFNKIENDYKKFINL